MNKYVAIPSYIDDVDTNHYSCTVCTKIPNEKIYQCSNGHPICADCMRKPIQDCIKCQQPYGEAKIRHQALEALLDKKKMMCSFFETGCDKKMKRHKVQEHELSCKYRPLQVCPQLGFYCQFSSNKVSEVSKHLEICHKIRRAAKYTIKNILHFEKTTEPQIYLYAQPVAANSQTGFQQEIIIVFKVFVEKNKSFVGANMYALGHGPYKARQFSANISSYIMNESANGGKNSLCINLWKGELKHYSQIKFEQEDFLFTLPFHYIKDVLVATDVQNADLRLRLEILPGKIPA